MKKGDKIIWDSTFGYDIGTIVNIYPDLNICVVDLNSGMNRGNSYLPLDEIHLYTEDLIKKLKKKYEKAV